MKENMSEDYPINLMAHKSLVTVHENWREMQNISDMS